MDSIQNMRVFVRVAQLGGFSAAARDLRLSGAVVTKHVATLERRVGALLLNRTTRKTSLTEAGRIYLERCLECLQAFEEADASVSALSGAPRGLLRVAAPVEFGNLHLPPIIAGFQRRHPEVTIELRLSNRMVDMVEEGVDIALRVLSGPIDASYVARPLASTRGLFWGSPEYLRKHGRPRRPEDLLKHPCLLFSEPVPLVELTFKRQSKHARIKLEPALLSNSGEALASCARLGGGLAMLPTFIAGASYVSGHLEPVLVDWSVMSARLFACYPHRRHLSPKVRAFVETLVATYGDDPNRDPWWNAE